MAFLFGIPKKLIQRIREIEIDTHYYDKDVVPSAQEIFTYDVNKKKEIATITGLVNPNTVTAVIPYQIHYDQTSQELIAKVTDLSENCFSNNNALKTITIPNTIHIIPTNCFKNCSALETVNIPTSIYTIKKNAFNNCDKLSSVFIPYGVNTIEDGAFLDCENLKIICYKHSAAENYAVTNNIPYSLISYTLDEDIKQNSENLVTSGVIWNNIKLVIKQITDHINNKVNPHDNSTFFNAIINNSTLNIPTLNDSTLNNSILNDDTYIKNVNIDTGTLNNLVTVTQDVNGEIINVVANKSLINKEYLDSSIKDAVSEIKNPTVGTGYQTIYDNTLETTSKTIVGAINEVNRGANTISGILEPGWNVVSLNTLYTGGWRFMNKPYCYTDTGICVDYRIKDTQVSNDTIVNNTNTFKIYVPCVCNYVCTTTVSDNVKILSGFPVDYLVLNYYYTGADGKDLDTVTGIKNANWANTGLKKTVGYGHSNSIVDSKGVELIKWGGDNIGGGSANSNAKFYESVYFDISAIQSYLPNEDIEVILYGTWYSEKGNAKINVSVECFTSTIKPTINVNSNTKQISLSNLMVDDEKINNPTYSNITEPISCEIPTKRGTPSNYETAYTPTFKIVFHKSDSESNYRTIEIQPLS